MSRSSDLFHKAQTIIPGGVNSPVRAFKSVGGEPIFFKSGKGAYLVDVDDKQYIDYVDHKAVDPRALPSQCDSSCR